MMKLLALSKFYFLLLLLFLIFLPMRQALGVCAQNPDKIILYENGSLVTDSNILLIDKDGNESLTSVCLNGICQSSFFSAVAAKSAAFVRIKDKEMKQELATIIDKVDPSLRQYPSNIRIPKDFINKALSSQIVYNFLDTSKIPNNFDYNYCAYQRTIEYDLVKEKIISFSESKRVGKPNGSDMVLPDSSKTEKQNDYIFLFVPGIILIGIIVILVVKKLNRKK